MKSSLFGTPTLSLYLLMVGSRQRLVELDDHVHRGAAMGAFESVEVFGQLVLLAVGKGQSGNQQSKQGQEREPCAPGRCLQDAVVREPALFLVRRT